MFDFQSLMGFYYIRVKTMLQTIDHEYDEGARAKKGIIRAVDLRVSTFGRLGALMSERLAS